MKLPIGRFGSFKPDRARITASATASTASSWPMTRLCSSSSRCSSFCISPSSSLDTGTPVQRLTTSAISSSSTSSFRRRGPRACFVCCGKLRFELAQLAVSELGGFVQVVGALRLFDLEPGLFELLAKASQPLNGFFLGLPLRLQGGGVRFQVGHLRSSLPSRSREAASVSFFRASRSISSCMMRRRISSSSAGMESISVRSFAAASSTRSMALSGRKRSEM